MGDDELMRLTQAESQAGFAPCTSNQTIHYSHQHHTTNKFISLAKVSDRLARGLSQVFGKEFAIVGVSPQLLGGCQSKVPMIIACRISWTNE